jgi:hypothetical protein
MRFDFVEGFFHFIFSTIQPNHFPVICLILIHVRDEAGQSIKTGKIPNWVGQPFQLNLKTVDRAGFSFRGLHCQRNGFDDDFRFLPKPLTGKELIHLSLNHFVLP